MTRVLELDAVSGGYGDTEILHGINLHVDAGEVVVVIGPNGAGKSTAMKAVFGLLNLTAGEVRLDGPPDGGDGQGPDARAENPATR